MADEKPVEFKQLTPEERDRITSWIASHWAHQNCPFCTHIDWRTANYLVATMTVVDGKVQVLGQGPGVYGFALVFCGFCGFTTLLHTGVLGLGLGLPTRHAKTPDK